MVILPKSIFIAICVGIGLLVFGNIVVAGSFGLVILWLVYGTWAGWSMHTVYKAHEPYWNYEDPPNSPTL
jgi:hypothetical protein